MSLVLIGYNNNNNIDTNNNNNDSKQNVELVDYYKNKQ